MSGRERLRHSHGAPSYARSPADSERLTVPPVEAPCPISLPPDAQLILACARGQIDEPCRQRMQAILGGALDWSRLIRVARRHAVLPLVYRHLKRWGGDAIPAEILGQLHQEQTVNALRSALLADELFRLLRLFRQHAIRVVAFKGPSLSLDLYGNLSGRQFHDLDLLVDKANLGRVTSLLESQGYRLPFSAAQRKDLLKNRYHFHFLRGDDLVGVEMHWAFTPRWFAFPLDEARLWEQVRYLSHAGEAIPCLSPEYSLLVLCAHGGKERWARLQLVCDVSELIRRHPTMDWDWILREIRRIRRGRVLGLGLGLARDLLDAPLPDDVLQSGICDRQVRGLIAALRRDMFAPGSGWPWRGWRLHKYQFTVWDRWQDRVNYARYAVLGMLPVRLAELVSPCEQDRAIVSLPRPLHFLYYLLRPLRLAARYGSPAALWRRLLEYF